MSVSYTAAKAESTFFELANLPRLHILLNPLQTCFEQGNRQAYPLIKISIVCVALRCIVADELQVIVQLQWLHLVIGRCPERGKPYLIRFKSCS